MDVLGIALEPKVVISKFGLLPKSLDLVQSLKLGIWDFLVLLYLSSPPPLSTMDPRWLRVPVQGSGCSGPHCLSASARVRISLHLCWSARAPQEPCFCLPPVPSCGSAISLVTRHFLSSVQPAFGSSLPSWEPLASVALNVRVPWWIGSLSHTGYFLTSVALTRLWSLLGKLGVLFAPCFTCPVPVITVVK